ncbi:MAG: dienelactone hydrolase family protein, partial [Pseudomonadota bacterium]
MNLRSAAICLSFSVLVACGGKDAPDAKEQSSDARPTTAEPSAATADAAQLTTVVVASDWFSYHETGEDLVRGYFAYPQEMVEPMPAVLLIHDWRGLDQSMRDVADRIAAAGYMVFAVDFFNGRTADNAQDAAALARELLEQTDEAESNLLDAYQFVTETAGAPKVAAVGWSMGGYWAVRSARLLPGQVSSVVNVYGQLDGDPEAIAATDAAALMIVAGNDRAAPMALQQEILSAADAADRRFEFRRFADVSVGFANEGGPRYEPQIAAEAWRAIF